MWDITWVGRHMTRAASGVPDTTTGVLGNREVKWRMNTINFGFGVALGQTRRSRVKIGVSLDMGTEKIFTRTGTNNVFDPAVFQLVQKNLMLGSTFCVHPALGNSTSV